MIKEANGSRGWGSRLVKVKGENGSYASLSSFLLRMMSLGMIVKSTHNSKKEKNIFTTLNNNWVKVIGLSLGIRKQCLALVESQKQLQRPTFGAYRLQLKTGHGICLY